MALVAGMAAVGGVRAGGVDSARFEAMRWRMIGPFRGGRTVGACGDLLHPNVFYIGVNNGGVWKSDDYGRTWNPIFDAQSTGSIGDVAVAPSNPNVVYVGSGEGIQRPDLSVGDGMFKSTDAGKTWVHLGLDDAQQIGGLAIDPNNENRVFAAVLGHPYGPNAERGVFRTTDGGQHWQKVLYTDENTGAIQVAIDPSNPHIVYADLLASRLAPWENGQWSGAGSGLYKSTDGGTTWKRLTSGLPMFEDGLGRIGFCICPSQPSRLYAVVSANAAKGGIYRSDDGGESWTKINVDNRLWDRGDDFAEIKADPKNPDIVYDANVVVWKSTDGGRHWEGFKGAPGGDDYHRLWINPTNPDVILCANDQGGIVTVNGGSTWSSWYNQPTAQLYHVSADNAFPYNVYSAQQESGSVGIASRGNDGAITFRDWHPVGAEEYGYVVADPNDPNIVIGGKISKYDKRTGQTQNISPETVPSGKYRFVRTAPIVFSPVDNHTLFYAGNVVFRTRNLGQSWEVISPDLSRETYDVPECIGIYRKPGMKVMPRRGVIYTLAPSPLDSNLIWAGTDDGLIWVTHDGGKNWQNVTPPGLTDWCKVSLMDASHFEKNTAYAAVNRIRLDDLQPHIYKTTDAGKSWQEVVHGLPNVPVNAVKEDPACRGLLLAATEKALFVSLNDGADWQSLRLNMPATSIRDVTVKYNDVIVATHGRSFWVLDDIMPLRDLAKGLYRYDKAVLYHPADVYRVRWDMNTDTPLPPDEPAGKNPPDGAIVDYYLEDSATETVSLTIRDARGALVRQYRSSDTAAPIPELNIPLYWLRPQQRLSAGKGAHRFLWDLRYSPLHPTTGFSIAAIAGDTPPEVESPWVMPGKYTVELCVGTHCIAANMQVLMDPRVTSGTVALRKQFDLSMHCYSQAEKLLLLEARVTDIATHPDRYGKSKNRRVSSAYEAAMRLNGDGTHRNAVLQLADKYIHIMKTMQNADVEPTAQNVAAITAADAEYDTLLASVEGLPHE